MLYTLLQISANITDKFLKKQKQQDAGTFRHFLTKVNKVL